MTISRRDLVDDLLGAHPELTRRAATAFVNDLIATIVAGLKKGDSIRLGGFGTFSVKQRAARTARNLKTGESIAVPPSNTVRFKSAKDLKAALNTPKKRKGSG
ncbi:MAG: HU family DNA-binding protein [Polyangiales bacterium]|jgi:nucleoid DNA-binding protein